MEDYHYHSCRVHEAMSVDGKIYEFTSKYPHIHKWELKDLMGKRPPSIENLNKWIRKTIIKRDLEQLEDDRKELISKFENSNIEEILNNSEQYQLNRISWYLTDRNALQKLMKELNGDVENFDVLKHEYQNGRFGFGCITNINMEWEKEPINSIKFINDYQPYVILVSMHRG